MSASEEVKAGIAHDAIAMCPESTTLNAECQELVA